MSFSSEIKEEILEKKQGKECCSLAITAGEKLAENDETNIEEVKASLLNNACCRKSFIRGMFLGAGCIIHPFSDYHAEIVLKSKKAAVICIKVLELLSLTAKCIKRNKAGYVVYIKEAEQIATLLSILGANNSLLKYESIRVERSVRNSINRTINCETANQTKTMDTAYVQIKAIEKLKEVGEFEKLPSLLKEVANVRIKYPEMSLSNLAEEMHPRLSKSGMNHRLKKLVEISRQF